MLEKPTEAQIKEYMEVTMKLRKQLFADHFNLADKKACTPLQFRGLMVVGHQPGLTVGELAEQFQMSSAAIAQYLQRLFKAKLLEKRSDQDDKRISRIHLTKLGQAELDKTKQYYYAKVREMLTPLSREELATMINLQKKLLK